MHNQRFGLYGLFAGLLLAFALNGLYGCASPAQADEPRDETPTIVAVPKTEFSVQTPVMQNVETPSTYVQRTSVGHASTYVTDDGITVDIEPGELIIYN